MLPPPAASPPPGRSADGAGTPGRSSGSRESSPCNADRCGSSPRCPGERRRSCVAEALAVNLAVSLGAALDVVPELHLPAHTRACGNRQRSGFDVAVDDARLEQLDALGVLDVADELTAHAHDARLDVALEARARIQAHVAIDLHVALEAAGDAYVTRACDLAFDSEVGGDDRFFHFLARRRTAGHFGADRCHIGPFRFARVRRRRGRYARSGSRSSRSPGIRIFPKRHEIAPLSD